jgi:hypothetical protein
VITYASNNDLCDASYLDLLLGLLVDFSNIKGHLGHPPKSASNRRLSYTRSCELSGWLLRMASPTCKASSQWNCSTMSYSLCGGATHSTSSRLHVDHTFPDRGPVNYGSQQPADVRMKGPVRLALSITDYCSKTLSLMSLLPCPSVRLTCAICEAQTSSAITGPVLTTESRWGSPLRSHLCIHQHDFVSLHVVQCSRTWA